MAGSMGDMPLAQPPPGVEPNFEHPASKKTMEIVVLSVILPITTLVLYLRVHARAVMQRNFDMSDWTLIAGYVATIGYTFLLLDLVTMGPGIGNHSWELHIKDIPDRYYSDLIATGLVQGVCMLFTKVSLLLLMARMFWVKRWARNALNGALGLTILAYVLYFILSLYYCVPRRDETPFTLLAGVGTSRCLNILKLGSFQTAFNAASDLFILGIAVHIIMGLQTSRGRRLKASTVFLFGLVVTALSICNAYYRIANNSNDPTWDYPTLFILTYYEISLSLVCACLPTLPVLGKSSMATRIMNSRIWSTLASSVFTRTGSSTRGDDSTPNDGNNSSTERLAHKDAGGVTVTRSFNVNNTYELRTNGSKKSVAAPLPPV